MPRYSRPSKKSVMKDKATQTPGPPLRLRSKSPQRRNPTPVRAVSISPRRKQVPVNRRPATTTFFPSRKKCQASKQERSPPLFQDDLTDQIGKNHNKIVKMLYQSPTKEECQSTINLIRCSPKGHFKILPPWR